jgi:hypothetical protein
VEPDPSEVYIAVRAHEVMLNEAAAAQERAVVPPLLTLNGGAAVAFLTLLGALGEDAPLSVDVTLAACAIGAWMFGLLLAATAQWAAAHNQSSINKGHRLVREGVEDALFPELAKLVAPVQYTPEERKAERTKARISGDHWSDAYRYLWMASAVVFVVGGILALIAVGSS